MMLEVLLEADPEWDSSTNWEALATQAAEAAIAESAFPGLAAGRDVELSVRLAGDAEVQGLNQMWRGKDLPTNVLSFPMANPDELRGPSNGQELMLGDVILAHGVCAKEATDKSIPIANHAAHLLVHGTLHLLGYDHIEEAAAADMEDCERRALARLGMADPYAAAPA